MTDLCTNMPDLFPRERKTESRQTVQQNTKQNTPQNAVDTFSDNRNNAMRTLVDERFVTQKTAYSIH